MFKRRIRTSLNMGSHPQIGREKVRPLTAIRNWNAEGRRNVTRSVTKRDGIAIVSGFHSAWVGTCTVLSGIGRKRPLLAISQVNNGR